MSDTVFKQVGYTTSLLVESIDLGSIGLPDIQRPFVWKNAKVRDLFDSMYRGYPVGYLLLWRNGNDRTIGPGTKQKHPGLVIVDGQQRLTSLYAVIKGKPVVRDNYESEHIQIAFNPLDECFEVADAAVRRDKSFVPDISLVWRDDTDIFDVADSYLKGVQSSSRQVKVEETKKIRKALVKLQSLLSFPFTALELAEDISEEDISDIFVRINSKGASLNQSDFILTLMSVFWDEGRAKLERFCHASRKPSKDKKPSPFNHFIEPYPEQLLRVGVGVAFKRARLQHVYSVLRGKDMDTEQFSTQQREAQFDKLRDAQDRTLDIRHWHDFMSCLRMAGFRSKKMISSYNNLLFSYMLYLIGKTEYKVDEPELRKIIAQWFFMSSITGRFTGSPESTMEFDLARLRGTSRAEEFVDRLRQVCEVSLTNDFWNVTLPSNLATSSPRSPSLFAYNASQVLLEAPVLFSGTKMADVLEPAVPPSGDQVDRHRLFSKECLASLGFSGTRDTNQIANYAYLEWPNAKGPEIAPEEYLPEMRERFAEGELFKRMCYFHALPEDWERMEYRMFLEKRRELMAQVTREGYRLLTGVAEPPVVVSGIDIDELVRGGESEQVEFKSSMRINLHTGKPDRKIELAVLKTLVGFLNTGRGTLLVGVSDDGNPLGVEVDGFASEDKMSLHLINIVNSLMEPGAQSMTLMQVHFKDYEGSRVLAVHCARSPNPVFVRDGDVKRFYVRTGPATVELSGIEMQNYIEKTFK